MATWRYVARRLHGDGTSTLLDPEVPLTDVQIDDVLSGINGLSGRISPEIQRLKAEDGLPLFEENSTAIFAESEGQIHGGGILTNSSFEGPNWDLECEGFIGYWQDMPYVGEGEYFVETDTLDIVREIIDHVQGIEGSDLGLTYDNTNSGLLVGSELASEEYDPEGGSGGLTLQSQAYKLNYYSTFDLLDNIESLSEDSPFDFRERHSIGADGEIISRLEFGVPRFHRKRQDLRFAIGENIFVKPEFERNGKEYASEVYALGAGEGAKMIRGHASTPRNGKLRKVAIVEDSSMRKLKRANSVAKRELAWRNKLGDFTAVIVHDTPHSPIGSVEIGDEIYVEGKTGWIEFGGWCRVLSRTLRPDSLGVMELGVARTDRIAS
jgi:hypothetical protein